MEFIKLQAGDYLVKNGTYYQVCSEEELLDLLSPASKKQTPFKESILFTRPIQLSVTINKQYPTYKHTNKRIKPTKGKTRKSGGCRDLHIRTKIYYLPVGGNKGVKFSE